TGTNRPDQGCHGYKSSRTSVPWVFCRRDVHRSSITLCTRLDDDCRGRSDNQPATGSGAAQPDRLHTPTRRYDPEYSNPKPLERTQNCINLGATSCLTL